MVPLLAKRAHQRSWARASTDLPGDPAEGLSCDERDHQGPSQRVGERLSGNIAWQKSSCGR